MPRSFEAMSERVCPDYDVRLVNLETGETEEQHVATCDYCGHELGEHDDPDWTGMVFCRVRGCDCSNYVHEEGRDDNVG